MMSKPTSRIRPMGAVNMNFRRTRADVGLPRPLSLLAFALRAVLLLVAVVPAAQAQDVVVREVEYQYNATTGLLEVERVDPGGTHCVQSTFTHDAFGNRQRVEVSPCSSTVAQARFTPRVTINEFSSGTDPANPYPAGAFQTLTKTGTSAAPRMSETTATFDARFGTVSTQTSVATADSTRNVTTRTAYDGFGRVWREYTPVRKNDNGSVDESYAEHKYVYCQGPKAPATPDAGCVNFAQTVEVDYSRSRRLVDTATGAVTNQAKVAFVTAYFVETTPYDATGTVIGARSRTHYDSLHRVIAKETESYDRSWVRTLTGYDELGAVAVTWSTHIGRLSNGSMLAPPDELRQWTAARDLVHRPLEERQYWRARSGDAATVLSAFVNYNGLEMQASVPSDSAPDGVARVSYTRKNGAGQVAQTENADGATLNLAYDAAGNLVRTVDALGHTTTVTYSATTARFKTGMVDPDQGSWSYEYDALGQLVKQTDARPVSIEMSYDALGRLIRKSAPSFVSQWYYDVGSDGTTACAGGLNRLCGTRAGREEVGVPPVASETYVYDKLGRPTGKTATLDRPYASTTTYDALGRVATVRYPTGFTVRNTYSAAADGVLPGVLKRVVDDANAARVFWSIDPTDVPASQVFDAKGKLQKAKLANGAVTIDNAFDSVSGKALSLRATGPASASVLDLAYEYDKVNNVRSRKRNDGPTGVTENFLYDVLDRITQYKVVSASDTSSEAWRTVDLKYNAIGNVLEKGDVGGYSYHPSDKPHAVRSAAGTSYQYDANGNVLTSSGRQIRTHVWNDFNQPTSMMLGASKVEFTYDAAYKRVKEVTTSASTERTLYLVHPDNAGGLSFEREETRVGGSLTRNESRHYIALPGAAVVIKTLNDAGAVSGDPTLTNYWLKDSLGSPITVLNASGGVVERMAFDAWGRRLRESGRLDPSLDPANGNRGYTGHEHLDELQLIHMNGRLYDPLIARFLSADPILQSPEDLQNYNCYSYVLNNPLRYTDPSGQTFLGLEVIAWKIIAATAGAAMIAEGNKHWRVVGSVMLAWSLGSQGAEFGGKGLIEAGLGLNAFGANMLTGFTVGVATTDGNLQAGMMGAFTAGAFGAVSGLGGPEAVFAHAAIGCAAGLMSSGECGPSALAAGFAKGVTQQLADHIHGVRGAIIVSVVGGTASVIGGGKFSNGAVQAGFGYLLNQLSRTREPMRGINFGADREAAIRYRDAFYSKLNPGMKFGELPVMTLQMGVGGQAGAWMIGVAAEFGIAAPTSLDDVCVYAQACAVAGPQLVLSGSGAVGLGQGAPSTGVQKSRGGTWFGGSGYFGGAQVTVNDDAQVSASRGVVRGGVGAGAGVGYVECQQATMCLRR